MTKVRRVELTQLLDERRRQIRQDVESRMRVGHWDTRGYEAAFEFQAKVGQVEEVLGK